MATARRADIEFLRVAAAFGIVIFHANVFGRPVAYSGLVIFVELTAYFAMRAPDGLALKTAIKLIPPYLTWYAIYLAVNIIFHRPLLAAEPSAATVLLVGSSIHLWYIPFILCVVALIDILKRRVSPPAIAAWAFVLLMVYMMAAPIWRPMSIDAAAPVGQWAHALAPALFGIALSSAEGGKRNAFAVIGILTFLIFCFLPYPEFGIPYFVGSLAIALLLVADIFRSPLRAMSINVPAWMAGVYFAHPLFLEAAMKIFGTMNFVIATGSFVACTLGVGAAYFVNMRAARLAFG